MVTCANQPVENRSQHDLSWVQWSRFSGIRRLRHWWHLVLHILESPLGCCRRLSIYHSSASVLFSPLLLSISASPVSLVSILSSFFKTLAWVFSCTTPCSIPSRVCEWLSLLLKICPSNFQLIFVFVLLLPSQWLQSVESHLAVFSSDSRISFFPSACDPVSLCLFHSSPIIASLASLQFRGTSSFFRLLLRLLLLLSHWSMMALVTRGFFFFLALPNTFQ